jgi:hypothetical protein
MRTSHVAINHAANYLAAINWHREFYMTTFHAAINHPAIYFATINRTAIYHVDIYHTAIYHTAIYLARGHLLCVFVLESHVFLDSEIDRPTD